MSLQLFKETEYKEKPVIIKKNTPNLSTLGISGNARSLTVSGDPWIVYSGKNYQGKFKCFTAGNYSPLSSWVNEIKSVRVVRDGLDNPRITLYEDVDYDGRAVLLKERVDSLNTHDFEKKTLSHKVTQGAWILYSNDTFGGDKWVTLKGDEVPNYSDINWENKLCSLKPVVGNDE